MKILKEICNAKCLPFYIGAKNVGRGPRIGGGAPIGVSPSFINTDTRYLMTLPYSDQTELSLFYSFDFFNDGPMSFHDGAYTLHSENSPLVEIVEHAISVRGKSGNLEFMSGRELNLEKALKGGDDSNVYEFHKFGGTPFFTREFDEKLNNDILIAYKNHFVHFVQLAFPVGPNDSLIDCDWPFGDAVFHLFIGQGELGIKYKYCWS